METSTIAKRVAAFIVAQVIQNQGEGNVIVPFHEIDLNFATLPNGEWFKDKSFLREIIAELYKYPQFDSDCSINVEITDEGFDCVAFTDYVMCEYEDEDDE